MLSFSIKADICTINEMYSKPDIFWFITKPPSGSFTCGS
jgi:hypothetical protein